MKVLNEHHTFTGMQRDLDVALHPAQFLYDARNIRLTPRNGDTTFAICNEKGTEDTRIRLEGVYLGHCLLNNYLVIFTHKDTVSIHDVDKDYIYRIDLADDCNLVTLYEGHLNFSPNYPIEAITSYENTLIQKVYWTDGLNQPRVINIVGDTDNYNDSSFDFVRELQLQETVSVEKLLGASGSFAPGVIQYALTYYTKYGQESNIFYTTPLMYISHRDRGASPEDKVDNAFKIIVDNPDTNFDYLRIYSIQRTSINAVPIVKRVADLSIKNYERQNPEEEATPYDYKQESVIKFRTSPRESYNDIDIVARKEHVESFEGTLSVLEEIDPEHPITVTYTGKWYKFPRSQFPNMQLKVKDGFVSWNPTFLSSPNSEILWANDRPIRIDNEYYFIALVSTDAGTLEEGILSLRAAKTVYDKAVVSSEGLTYIDTGTEGDSVDPMELLYKGGESITAKTLEQKDNTLFLGNIGIIRPQIDSTLKDSLVSEVTFENTSRSFKANKISGGAYNYANQLTSFEAKLVNNNWQISNKTVPCGGFKRGDYYRLGVQFQHKTGKWSDPVYLKDFQIGNPPEQALNNPDIITVPTIKGTIKSNEAIALIGKDYKKVRAVVVFPDMQDRVTVCQGVVCPTVFTRNNRSKGSLHAQSSWFFRTSDSDSLKNDETEAASVGAVSVGDNEICYLSRIENVQQQIYPYDPSHIRHTEIQGDFNSDNQFQIDKSFLTMHSPDIEFDDSIALLNLTNLLYRKVGNASIEYTLSDINIQTETPQISNNGSGFIHQPLKKRYSLGYIAGLFYDDFLVDDNGTNIESYSKEKSPVKWVMYPWHRSGSINNDIERPADSGIRSSVLKKKIISNLRYASTSWDLNIATPTDCTDPQVFNSDALDILKAQDKIYQGNIDTLLSPDYNDGTYFVYANDNITIADVDTPIYAQSEKYWKTGIFTYTDTNNNSSQKYGISKWNSSSHVWNGTGDPIGNENLKLACSKENVRMKYKSSPHIILPSGIGTYPSNSDEGKSSKLYIYELLNKGDNPSDTNNPTWRNTMFGGNTSYGNPIPNALQNNIWVPCGEPVSLGDGSADVDYYYSYGDTYYQRWDCLKTYPFTPEDINQIVEIGSFMLETRVNIDGRYDRNRGQLNNTMMSPQNFNLLNPVYSQIDNFFSYRILDEQYYSINRFPNEITWTKEKTAGADTDMWTNITLGSTYDMDGSKGEVISLNLWRDNIYCFQNKGVSNILFNSRVQIPTSDGMPIEISNSYKVDGYRNLSDGVGCKDARLIKETPAGVYFMDSISSHLYYIGDGIQDISATHNMSSWFNQEGNLIQKLLYDDVNKDVYLVKNNESLCYSELLGQFTGFYDYDNIKLIESWDKCLFTVKDGRLHKMFEGLYNDLLGYYDTAYNTIESENPEEPPTVVEYQQYNANYRPWYFTFISNGIDQSTQDFDKIFTNVDYRMDIQSDDTYWHDDTLSYIQAWNEYQDTGKVTLGNKNGAVRYTSYPKNYLGSNVQKKFRIWRLQIPRDSVKKMDRIRNTWCKVTLGRDFEDSKKSILHDLNVQYYV